MKSLSPHQSKIINMLRTEEYELSYSITEGIFLLSKGLDMISVRRKTVEALVTSGKIKLNANKKSYEVYELIA